MWYVARKQIVIDGPNLQNRVDDACFKMAQFIIDNDFQIDTTSLKDGDRVPLEFGALSNYLDYVICGQRRMGFKNKQDRNLFLSVFDEFLCTEESIPFNEDEYDYLNDDDDAD